MVNGIYSLITEERLDDVLGNLSSYTSLPIFLMDRNGLVFKKYGRTLSYCSIINNEVYKPSECIQQYIKAADRAGELGEGYIFSCHANLNLIAFSLVSGGETLCTVFVGPFLMDSPDSTLISDIAEKTNIGAHTSLMLYDELESIQVIQPGRVQMLKKLVDDLLTPLLPSERALLLQKQEKAYQQAKISETLQIFRDQPLTNGYDYYYGKESELMASVRKGDVKEAKALLNELLGYVLFSDFKNLDSIRMHATELTVLLSRVAIEGGADCGTIMDLNRRFMALMEQEQDIDDLCLLLQEVVESFTSAMFDNHQGENLHVRRTMQYIAEHYSEKISLEEIADKENVTPNYLSTLFHSITGRGFADYLNYIRVEESKRLLLTTDYPLSQIAVSMGFGDQSHYCRVFKKYTGISPGKFRA